MLQIQLKQFIYLLNNWKKKKIKFTTNLIAESKMWFIYWTAPNAKTIHCKVTMAILLSIKCLQTQNEMDGLKQTNAYRKTFPLK